ncbi:hypothetical protein [Clostridium novyi]|uniref:hypothetical protein n=1 Tax=Clostridium novyi TaxID=1542 RepID=UPI0004D5A353|nr:hypothetical protein [Clostridium novyi]KEH84761.1 hypothetical protein Z965_p0065 [Clostridium novyi A str. BKT29909]
MYLLINEKFLKDNITGKELNFDKIVKHNNNIYCYIENHIILSLEGISNIDDYKVENGEFSNPPKTKEELQQENVNNLVQTIANLNLENRKKDAMATTLAQTVANLNLRLNKLEKEGR